jgi:type IV pilus assembly protein PilA
MSQGETMNRKQKGFSLIELLIVVAIILIIAAIAIPNLLRSRMAANEASAVGSLRTVNTAAVTFSSVYGDGFPPSIGVLGGASGTTVATCKASLLIDTVLSGAGVTDPSQKSGYNFTLKPGAIAIVPVPTGCTAGNSDGYEVMAYPISIGATGQRSFCSDASGVIRFDPSGTTPATGTTCPVAMSPLQ